MPIRVILFIGLLGLLACAAAGAQQTKASTYVHKIINIETDDGREIPAILTHPESGVNPYAPAFVHHHGGPGGNPVNYSGAPRFFARGAAEAGYTSVSLLSHHSRFYYKEKFSTAVDDIKAAVDFLDDYGVEDILLTGHSLGGVRVSRYLADTNDIRIKALVQFAPTRDMPRWVRRGMGETAYDKLMDKAKKLLADGRSKELMSIQFTPSEANDSPLWPASSPVQFVHNAETLLDWWGPEANTHNSKLLAQVEQPILLVAGDADAFMYDGILDDLKKTAAKSARVDTIFYKGIGHIFAKNRPQVIADTLAWVDELGYGVKPQIDIDLVDAKTVKGRTLSGVIYSPTDGENKDKPAFLLLHRWADDVMSGSSHWLGVRLAQAGYTSVAMRLGVSGRNGIIRKPLESVVDDIGAWTYFLNKRGYEKLVGAGHSTGGIWLTTYANSSKDDRIKGIIYLSPVPDMPEYIKTKLNDQKAYDTLINTARKAVADGKGSSTLISADLLDDENHKQAFPYFQYANVFLSYWAPGSKSVHAKEIAKVKFPIFVITGSEDGPAPANFIKEFTDAAGGKHETAVYQGAPLSLAGAENDVSRDVIDWTRRHFE